MHTNDNSIEFVPEYPPLPPRRSPPTNKSKRKVRLGRIEKNKVINHSTPVYCPKHCGQRFTMTNVEHLADHVCPMIEPPPPSTPSKPPPSKRKRANAKSDMPPPASVRRTRLDENLPVTRYTNTPAPICHHRACDLHALVNYMHDNELQVFTDPLAGLYFWTADVSLPLSTDAVGEYTTGLNFPSPTLCPSVNGYPLYCGPGVVVVMSD